MCQSKCILCGIAQVFDGNSSVMKSFTGNVEKLLKSCCHSCYFRIFVLFYCVPLRRNYNYHLLLFISSLYSFLQICIHFMFCLFSFGSLIVSIQFVFVNFFLKFWLRLCMFSVFVFCLKISLLVSKNNNSKKRTSKLLVGNVPE